ncbi:MAG TPA: extracellular solute-binding protein [Bauldia sp.]|nr:extracellular solute-binding protein [Bauldia sp.]
MQKREIGSRVPGIDRRRFLAGTSSLGAAAFLGSGLFPNPGIAQAKTLTVTTMPGPRWEGALRASAKAYQTAHPDVEVNILVSPYAEHYQRIGTSLAEDSSDFDLHLFDPVLIGQSHPKLLPLSELFDSDPEWRDYYLQGVPEFYRGSWSWDGVPYSVVHDANCMMTWWRTDIFDEMNLPEPATFEIILENAKALNERKPGSGYMTCGARNAWFLGMTYTGMMHGFGGRWYENDTPDRFGRIDPSVGPGKLLLDSRENLATMTMLAELAKVWNPASVNAQEFENAEAFKNDVVYQQNMWSGLMLLQNPKENPNYASALISRDFPIGGSNKDTSMTGMKGGFGLAIPKACKDPQLAFDFAKFVASQENAENFILGGGQPSNTTLLNTWGEKHEYQVFKSIALGIAHGHHLAQFPEGPEFFQLITQHAGNVVTGAVTAEEGCQQMQADATTLFERAGYL